MESCDSSRSSYKNVTIQDSADRPTLELPAIHKRTETERKLDISIAERKEKLPKMMNRKSLASKARDMMLTRQKVWRP